MDLTGENCWWRVEDKVLVDRTRGALVPLERIAGIPTIVIHYSITSLIPTPTDGKNVFVLSGIRINRSSIS